MLDELCCSVELDELEDVASFMLEELRSAEELEDCAILDDDFAVLLEEFAALDELATLLEEFAALDEITTLEELATLLEDNCACLTQRM